MRSVELPAIKLNQNGMTLYLMAANVGDLLDIADVDTWRADLAPLEEDDPRAFLEEQGYQREAVSRYYTKVATYINQAHAILPTSILLSARDRRLAFRPS